MEDKNRKLEELLQTPCYSIDFLPQPIPPAALSQFRTIQHHLLNSEKRRKSKTESSISSSSCSVFSPPLPCGTAGRNNPALQLIEQAVDIRHGKPLRLTVPAVWQEESLLVFGMGALSLSLYHPSQQLLDLAQTIARSEGFFLYQF